MEEKRISQQEQQCISRCIQTHWGKDAEFESETSRDRRYEACLENCRICG